MTLDSNDPELLPFGMQAHTVASSDEDIDELQKLWDEHLQSVPTPKDRNPNLK